MHFKSIIILACISLALALPTSEKREDSNLDKRLNAKDEDLDKRGIPFWMMQHREDNEENVEKRGIPFWMMHHREDNEENVNKRFILDALNSGQYADPKYYW